MQTAWVCKLLYQMALTVTRYSFFIPDPFNAPGEVITTWLLLLPHTTWTKLSDLY